MAQLWCLGFIYFRSSNSVVKGSVAQEWYESVLLAQLDKVCRGALVADFGGLLYHPFALPAILVSLAPALRPHREVYHGLRVKIL